MAAHITTALKGHSLARLLRPLLLSCLSVAVISAHSALGDERVAKKNLKTAREEVDRAEGELRRTTKRLKKAESALEKAQTREREQQAEVAEIEEEFRKATADKKLKAGRSLQNAREDLVEDAADRGKAEQDFRRLQAQAEQLATQLAASKQRAGLAEQEYEAAKKHAAAIKAAQEGVVVQAPKPVKTPTVKPVPAPLEVVIPAPKPVKTPTVKPVPAPPKVVTPAPKPVKTPTVKPVPAPPEVVIPAPKPVKTPPKVIAASQEPAPKPVKTKKTVQRAAAARKPAKVPVPVPRHLAPAKETVEIMPWTTATPEETPVLPGDITITAPPAKKADIADTPKRLTFDLPMVSGDREIVEGLEAWQDWAEYVTFNPVTADEINEFHGVLIKALQEEGYVFAKVTFPTRIWAYGIFLAKVDCGVLGKIAVKGNRYYSAKQIVGALAKQDTDRFNYARIHGDLFEINTRPDITIDSKLRPTVQDGRRVINADLQVRDDLPIHGAVEASNTGTSHTNRWRFRTTVQHMNLTRNDDILTADWITSPDMGDVNAFSGGYYLPIGQDYSLSVYGGYSHSDIEDVLPQLDVRGKGHFFGAQVTKTIKDTPKSRMQLSAGWLFQHSQTQHEVLALELQERDLDLSMPMLTFGYASRAFDKLGGRNFFSNTIKVNAAGALGSSEKHEFNEEGAAFSDGEFVINQFQLARLQRFFRGDDAPGKWTLFMKVDGQLASDTLVAAVRRGVGGANSIRGYKEQEISGDEILSGSLELRTPLMDNFIPGLKQEDDFLEANPDAWQRHRLQLIAFTDFAYLNMKHPLPGERKTETFASAGVGLRLGLTKYSQMRIDYGYPFEKSTEQTPDSGRVHMSLQLQF